MKLMKRGRGLSNQISTHHKWFFLPRCRHRFGRLRCFQLGCETTPLRIRRLSSACLCLMSRVNRLQKGEPVDLPISASSQPLLQLQHAHQWYFADSARLGMTQHLRQAPGDCLNDYRVSSRANPWDTTQKCLASTVRAGCGLVYHCSTS